MAEHINREELIKALEADYNRAWSSKPQGVEEYVEGARDEYDDVLKIVCGMKAADVQPIKRGRWISSGRDNDYNSYCRCSRCDHEIVMYRDSEKKPPNYCENCGARMMKDGDTE